ncbi:MAG: glycosyltransferase [Bacteroidetes bacterium]|nr:glycosyltransferase [Bacteroidota bacterium]
MHKRPIIAVTVSNDLATDQRVLKVCRSLYDLGYMPRMIGRKLPESIDMPDVSFEHKRMKLLFTSGPAFYAELNLRLFFLLLFSKLDFVHANDLDTLLPAYLVSVLRRKPLVYDTHEYFTGVPEIQKRPLVKKIWKGIESFVFPKLKRVITVNDSIASLYENDYGILPKVIRNIPTSVRKEIIPLAKKDIPGVSEDDFVIILQGAGINVDRGAEEAVEMMKHLEGCKLIIAGSGDVIGSLKIRASQDDLNGRIIFLPKMKYSELMQITAACNLGLTLDKDTNINYRYSLPNKIFDYIHAGIPVFASNLPEVRKVVEQYGVGFVAESHNPEVMAAQINSLKSNPQKLSNTRAACRTATEELRWEKESVILELFYPKV